MTSPPPHPVDRALPPLDFRRGPTWCPEHRRPVSICRAYRTPHNYRPETRP